MKTKLITFIALMAFAVTAVVASPKRITVVNKTSKAIHYIYISESENSEWEDDVLGDDVLAAGQRFTVTFNGYQEGVCSWDFKAVDEDGKEYFVYNVNLCQVGTINITP